MMRVKIKQSDEARQSTTTMTDDSELTVALAAGSTYFFDCMVVIDSGATPDTKLSWVYTGTITSVGFSEGIAACSLPNAATADDGRSRAYDVGTGGLLTTPTVRLGVAGSNTANSIGGWHLRGVIVTNSSGNLKLQWAQNTSDPSNTTVHAGSYIAIALAADMDGTLTYKTGDTSRTNNTRAADPDLQFPTAANSKYIAEYLAVWDSNSATPDSIIALSDANASHSLGHVLAQILNPNSTFGSTVQTLQYGQWNSASWVTTPTTAVRSTSTTANKNSQSTLFSHQMTGSAGTCAFEWAQNTTNATATIMRTGSWILSEEVFQ